MKKYLLFPLCAALCLLAGCADDFPTELNRLGLAVLLAAAGFVLMRPATDSVYRSM